MCLIINPMVHPKNQFGFRKCMKAETDLYVVKRFDSDSLNNGDGLVSPFRHKHYKIGKTYKVRMKKCRPSNKYSIYKGFHAYLLEGIHAMYFKHLYYVAKIPKGSYFWVSEGDSLKPIIEIVSNKLEIVEPYGRPYNWLTAETIFNLQKNKI